MKLFEKQKQQEKLDSSSKIELTVDELNSLITKAIGEFAKQPPSESIKTEGGENTEITDTMLINNYKSLYEAETAKTSKLDTKVKEVQATNLELAKQQNLGHKTQSVSDILRDQEYHPLYKAKKA